VDNNAATINTSPARSIPTRRPGGALEQLSDLGAGGVGDGGGELDEM
jgi:hypothetical protein